MPLTQTVQQYLLNLFVSRHSKKLKKILITPLKLCLCFITKIYLFISFVTIMFNLNDVIVHESKYDQ